MSCACAVLILTEDSSPHAHETVSVLLKKLLQRVEPGLQTHRILAEEPPAAIRKLMAGNAWRCADRSDVVDLVRTIARRLAKGDGVVLVHFDGDSTWGERSECKTAEQFEKRIVESVRQHLTQTPGPNPNAPEGVEVLMDRLIRMVPHYSIEAWLYQATDRAVQLCSIHHRGKDAVRFGKWAADRGALDEVKKPKNATCLGASHNLDLAKSLTAAAIEGAVAASKSMHRFVESLRACNHLTAAIAP